MEDRSIGALKVFLGDLFEHCPYVKTWVGALPPDTKSASEFLAAQIGYPESEWGGSPSGFVTRGPHEAAVTLAMLATQSQAYEFNRLPPVELTTRIEDWLRSCLPDGRFVSNADHPAPWVRHDPPFQSGEGEHVMKISASRSVSVGVSLSSATFDTGLIGFDEGVGFIAWAEEED